MPLASRGDGVFSAAMLLLLTGTARADTLHATLRIDGDAPTLVHASIAEGDAPLPEGDLEVLDVEGHVVGTGLLPPGTWFRSVLTPSGHDTARDPARYARVHLPWPAGSRAVRLGTAVVDVASDPRVRRVAAPAAAEPVLQSGPPAERLDLVFFAEGYPAFREEAFAAHVDAVVDHLLAIEPWSAYTGVFNVWRVFVPSAQRGIDQAEGADLVDSPFECFYGCGLAGQATGHLICCDQDLIADLVDATAPFADGIMLLVDDTRYGGSGGLDYSTSYTGDEVALQVASHELGHTLIKLWDEYPYGITELDAEAMADPSPSDGIDDITYVSPNCSPEDAPVAWEAWLDDGAIEWPLWHAVQDLRAARPFRHADLVCDGRDVAADEVCAYESCSFTDWVRPTRGGCIMHDLGETYCPVCREAIVKAFYAGLGGSLVRSAQPAPGARVVVDEGETVAFEVDAAGPDAGLRWRWAVDGRTVHEGPDFVLDGSEQVCGTLSLTLTDETPWVRHDPDGLLEDVVTWPVRTGPCCGCATPGAIGAAPAWLALATLLRRRRR